MGHDRPAPKQAFEFTLDSETVREARLYTTSLDRIVGDLLRTYVREQKAMRVDQSENLEVLIDFLNDVVERHGVPGADYSPI